MTDFEEMRAELAERLAQAEQELAAAQSAVRSAALDVEEHLTDATSKALAAATAKRDDASAAVQRLRDAVGALDDREAAARETAEAEYRQALSAEIVAGLNEASDAIDAWLVHVAALTPLSIAVRDAFKRAGAADYRLNLAPAGRTDRHARPEFPYGLMREVIGAALAPIHGAGRSQLEAQKAAERLKELPDKLMPKAAS